MDSQTPEPEDDVRDDESGAGFFRGVGNALLLALPFWVLVLYLIFWRD